MGWTPGMSSDGSGRSGGDPKEKARRDRQEAAELKAYRNSPEGKKKLIEQNKEAAGQKQADKDYAKHGKQIHGTNNAIVDQETEFKNRDKFLKKPGVIDKIKGALPAFKKGGVVKKTGKALVHKGEVVLNKGQQKKVGPAKVKAAITPAKRPVAKKK